METYGSHHYPGRLFVVEGVDGSGKSTQIALLRQWLISEGYTVFFSEWNSSPLVKKTTSRGKKRQILTPSTFSLIHATDFADRTEHDIIPPLKAGAIVLADRYIYTAFARDVARGVDSHWVRELYRFAVRPTLAFYYRVPLEISLNRILMGRSELKHYEAGMDLGLSNDPYESFKIFQQRIVDEYDAMVNEFGLTVMDATLPIPEQQRRLRQLVSPYLQGVRRLRTPVQELVMTSQAHRAISEAQNAVVQRAHDKKLFTLPELQGTLESMPPLPAIEPVHSYQPEKSEH
jgi:dTMP kinase